MITIEQENLRKEEDETKRLIALKPAAASEQGSLIDQLLTVMAEIDALKRTEKQAEQACEMFFDVQDDVVVP